MDPVATAKRVATVIVMSLFPATLAAARAEPGLQFLDSRPIVIDLDDLPEPLARWRVRVFQGQPNERQTLQLHVLFQPEGVLGTTESVAQAVRTGELASFVIELKERVPAGR